MKMNRIDNKDSPFSHSNYLKTSQITCIMKTLNEFNHKLSSAHDFGAMMTT